jgi:hypothetical protein
MSHGRVFYVCQGLPGLPVALGHRRLSHTVGKVCSLGLPLALFQLGWFPVPTGLKGPLGLSRQAEPKGSVDTHMFLINTRSCKFYGNYTPQKVFDQKSSS